MSAPLQVLVLRTLLLVAVRCLTVTSAAPSTASRACAQNCFNVLKNDKRDCPDSDNCIACLNACTMFYDDGQKKKSICSKTNCPPRGQDFGCRIACRYIDKRKKVARNQSKKRKFNSRRLLSTQRPTVLAGQEEKGKPKVNATIDKSVRRGKPDLFWRESVRASVHVDTKSGTLFANISWRQPVPVMRRYYRLDLLPLTEKATHDDYHTCEGDRHEEDGKYGTMNEVQTHTIRSLKYNAKYEVEISIENPYQRWRRAAFKTPACANVTADCKWCDPDDIVRPDEPRWLFQVACMYRDPQSGLIRTTLQWPPVANESSPVEYKLEIEEARLDEHNVPFINRTELTLNNTMYTRDLRPLAHYTFMLEAIENEVCIDKAELQMNATATLNMEDKYWECAPAPIPEPLRTRPRMNTLAYILAAVVATLVLVVAGTYAIYRKHRGFSELMLAKSSMVKSNSYKSAPGVAGNISDLYTDELAQLIRDEWEISPKDVKLGSVLGQGAFGKVMHGYYQQQRVAIKVLKDGLPISYREDLLCEISVMKRIPKHPHIVSLVGACTLDEPLALIMEYVPYGNLQTFLKNCRIEGEMRKIDDGYNLVYHVIGEKGEREQWTVTPTDMVSFARQIALAMEHVSGMKYVHRDLAARNVLVGPSKLLKLCDFGLCRYLYDHGEYHKLSAGKLPLKWMAVESLADRVFTPASDVWAFGVVLWEIVTLGASPYPHVALSDLYTLLSRGYRMEQPRNCSDELYDIMSQCWCENPSDRPTFTNLRDQLDTLLGQKMDYLELDKLDFAFSQSDTSSASATNSLHLELSVANDVVESDLPSDPSVPLTNGETPCIINGTSFDKVPNTNNSEFEFKGQSDKFEIFKDSKTAVPCNQTLLVPL